MAVISGTTVNWGVSPRIIVIPIPVLEATIEDLQDTCQDLEDSEIGIVFPKLRTISGGEDLGGGTSVGFTLLLNNAQIQFAGRTTATESGAVSTSDTTGTLLNAAGGAFVTNGVLRGDTVFNNTTGSMATIISVTDNQNLVSQVLSGGARTTWLNTDTYTIYVNAQCTAGGGNLVAVDDVGATISPILQSANTNVTLTSSSSATSTNQADIEYASYDGSINIDAVLGTTAALGATGSSRAPFDNLTDALAEDATRKFKSLRITGDFTFGASDVIDDFDVIGQGLGRSVLTFTSGCSTSNTKFFAANLTGTVDGSILTNGCDIVSLLGIGGGANDMFFINSIFDGDLTLKAGNTGNLHFHDCKSGVAGTSTPIVDINGTNTDFDFRGYIGGLEIVNNTASNNASIDLDGHIIIGASNTAGTIVVRGTGKATVAESANPYVDRRNFVQASTQEAALFFDGVTIDATGTTDSDSPLAGSHGNAAANDIVALAVAVSRNLSIYNIVGTNVLTGDHSAAYSFRGIGSLSSVLVLSGTQDITNCNVEDVIITGSGAHSVLIRNGISLNLSDFTGFMKETALQGTITLGNVGNSGLTGLSRCQTIPPGITIDCTASGSILFMEACEGTYTITNKTGAEAFQLGFAECDTLTIDATCTAGSINVIGNCTIVDNSGVGCTVTDNTNTKLSKDLHQFKGLDNVNPIVRGGDGVTSETLTVDGKELTITPTSITRTI